MSPTPSLARRAVGLVAPFLVALASAACARTMPLSGLVPSASGRYPIVPLPRRLVARSGEFRLDHGTRIVLPDTASTALRAVAELFAVPVRAASGLPLPIAAVSAGDGAPNTIAIRLTSTTPSGEQESYRLVVTERGASLSAPTVAGLVNGLATLRQLLPPALERSVRRLAPWRSIGGQSAALAPVVPDRWTIPAVEIEDAPRFRYRGILLDVGRYYFPPEFLKELVDLLALYKLNVLQLHLTDDQGWRLEIKKYPRLTTVGAWRKETVLGQHFDPYVGDRKPHGGFYTQEEIRDLVAYAAARHVTIIPEIEMPGHSGAALAAYPELSCTGGPLEVSTVWGVHEDVFCPSERTFAFLEDVLTEVMQLFPSEYIHVGGDEVPKTRWKASPVAQAVIRREHLANEEELQSYFIRRMERFLRTHGRKLIGWDEILEGGIAPEATVMSWRGMQGGIAAARQRHDVIMSPGQYAYLDHYQGDPAAEPLAIGDSLPLDTVYAFEPVPPQLTPAQAAHIVGAQGNLWTEYISTPTYAEYMLLPRMLALSEVAWSPKEARSWNGFLARLPAQFARLDALGVNYRVPEPIGPWGERQVVEERTHVRLASPIPGGVVRYTMDGSEPTASSARYTGPVDVRVTPTPVTVSARLFLASGRASPVVRGRIVRARWKSPADVRADVLEPGLAYAYREGTFASADDVRQTVWNRAGSVPDVRLRGDERPEQYGVRLTGFLRVPKDALYTFHLVCDDGAKLRIDGEVVVDHDGQHDVTEKRGQIALRAGYHPVEVVFFQAGGGAALRLDASAAGVARRPVPAEWFGHAAHGGR
jgi:hexosaminidase